ncbi:MAG: hypothetical protein AB7T07_08590 [Steroidobacteraceae bacterium]
MNTVMKIAATGAVLLLGQAASAANSLEDLALFKSGGLTQGLWGMELLSSSDPMMTQGAAAMGKMNVCVDVAKQMSRNNQLDEQNCTPKVLRNSRDAAEIDVSCKDGSHSHVKIDRESEKSYLLDSSMTSADGKARSFKARYRYEGACKGDSAIQLDKNSAACKQMGNVDMTKMAEMCAKAPEQYRAQCEQQMKQMGSMCQ